MGAGESKEDTEGAQPLVAADAEAHLCSVVVPEVADRLCTRVLQLDVTAFEQAEAADAPPRATTNKESPYAKCIGVDELVRTMHASGINLR